jgi:glutathione S-transferase
MAPITFYHCPWSRSSMTLFLLEELGVPYEIKLTDVRAGAGQAPEYLAINPMGKVPAIVDDGQVVTESGAICLYLADKYAEACLAPPIGDPRRAAYVRWLFLAPISDVVLVERMMGREPIPAAAAGYGDYERLMRTYKTLMTGSPWLLGEQFTAADVVICGGLPWAFAQKTLPQEAPFAAYAERIEARPAYQRAQAKDVELQAALKPT